MGSSCDNSSYFRLSHFIQVTHSFLEDLIYYYMDSGRVFARFTLLYSITANVNTYNSTVPEENEGGKWPLSAAGGI